MSGAADTMDRLPMSPKSSNIVYEVNDRIPLWLAVVMGIQHVMLIYGEVALLPVIVGRKAGAPAEHILFASCAAGVAAGIITLIQVLRLGRIGAGYTLFMGSSAAYLAGSLETLKTGGFPLLATLSILVAPIEILMAYFLRFLRHIVTPTVGGVIILLVVISLVPVSIHEWVGEEGHAFYNTHANFLIGLSAMAILLGLALFGNKTLRLWCPMIGMAGGLLTSWILGQFTFQDLLSNPWLGAFPGRWPGLTFDLKPDYLPLFATLAVLTVINGVQAIGNSMAVQQISHREPRHIDYGVIQGTMYADALGNIASGVLGTVPNETYSENISVLKVTGVASRMVGVCGAILLIILPFSPKIGMALVKLPDPVFGGFLMGLAAMMMPAGLDLVFARGITHRTGLLVGISLCVGLVAETRDFFPALFPVAVQTFLSSGVAAGGLAAVLLSVVFRLMERQGYAASIPVGIDHLPALIDHVEQAGNKLDLSREQILRLHLACEEMFVHIARSEGSSAKVLALRITHQEGELRVEMIHGERLDNLEGFTMPENLLTAEPSELDRLGLVLFGSIVRDLHQAVISGNTYIWFTLD
jgi:NCS2 family nucleobase:cation symporter-2/xanthine permease XanP